VDQRAAERKAAAGDGTASGTADDVTTQVTADSGADDKAADDTADDTADSGADADDTPNSAGAGTADGAAPVDEAADDAVKDAGGGAAGAGPAGWRGRHPAAARAAAWAVSASAAGLVLFALLLPNTLSRLSPYAFVRIPIEGVIAAFVLLALRPWTRWAAAVLGGIGLGVLTIVKLLDMGFYSVLDRPFDPVLDWSLLGDAQGFVRESVGRAGEIAAVLAAIALAVAFVAVMPLAVMRLTRLMVAHRTTSSRTAVALGTAWVACGVLGVQVAGVPVASASTVKLLRNRTHQLQASFKVERAFAKKAAVDAFRNTPPDRLLTGLRGKDVIFAFVESYGRDAIEDPEMAPEIGAVLANQAERLGDAGYSAKSAFLTSPTTGAHSWLAHSTFLSGLWIDNDQSYHSLTSSDRLTLTGAFQRTKAWRTVGIMPGVRRAWPEGKYFRLDQVYDSRNMGYRGPNFAWAPIPDQFALAAFERLEHGRPGGKPLASEIVLASSHNPWAPLPRMVGWDQIGDGSIYHAIKREGKRPKEVWRDPAQVRAEYRRAIVYSLTSLLSYLEKYGKKDTVLVFLGDHQPVPTVVGPRADRDVPISIVARDKDVLERVSGWGWHDGLKPGPTAPVWRMNAFRDRFLSAYGPRPGSPSERANATGHRPTAR
jgi:hypothetical protein